MGPGIGVVVPHRVRLVPGQVVFPSSFFNRALVIYRPMRSGICNAREPRGPCWQAGASGRVALRRRRDPGEAFATRSGR